MKYGIVAKFLAFVLCALSLVATVGGSAGIVIMENAGLYSGGVEGIQDQEYDSISKSIARSWVNRYAADTLSNASYPYKEEHYPDPRNMANADHWDISVAVNDVVMVAPDDIGSNTVTRTYHLSPQYVILSTRPPDYTPETSAPTTPGEGSTPTEPTVAPRQTVAFARPAYVDVEVPENYLYYEEYLSWNDGEWTLLYQYYYQAPEYAVTVYMDPEILDSSYLHILTTLYPSRYSFIAIVIIGLLVFAVTLVYLMYVAGRTRNGTIRPGGLNRLPLDLYTAAAAFGIWGLIIVLNTLLSWVSDEGPHLGNLTLTGINLLAIIVLILGVLMALAAQVKMGGRYLWDHTLTGFLCKHIGRFLQYSANGLRGVFHLLPVIWQWVAIACAMGLALCVFLLLTLSSGVWVIALVAVLIICLCIVLYGGYCFGTLLTGAQRMAEGNLNQQIPLQNLKGAFLDFGRQLNALSETAMLAARQQLRSERTKTELITNVSHDIKTPLTSIINFVDLLQKTHTPEQQQEYLEVLARQSARMKRLIEDLMDLSQASAGNIQCNLQPMDAAEAINQALGEFSDRLDAACLTPVFQAPDAPVMITADGRLFWRVISNLLSNAVKYAMPGTRLYIDLLQAEDTVLISLKNVSREHLQLGADELMERFVQGDTSRHTDGSGLGLNIAQSLMEVQGGKLHLLIDGDLFKVTLSLPALGAVCS